MSEVAEPSLERRRRKQQSTLSQSKHLLPWKIFSEVYLISYQNFHQNITFSEAIKYFKIGFRVEAADAHVVETAQ